MGCVLIQPEMRSTVVVIRNVAGQHAPQMALAEPDYVVRTLAPEGSDQPLRVRMLPPAGWLGDDFPDTHAGDAAPEHLPIALRLALCQAHLARDRECGASRVRDGQPQD